LLGFFAHAEIREFLTRILADAQIRWVGVRKVVRRLSRRCERSKNRWRSIRLKRGGVSNAAYSVGVRICRRGMASPEHEREKERFEMQDSLKK
jgi:hypothetical protein